MLLRHPEWLSSSGRGVHFILACPELLPGAADSLAQDSIACRGGGLELEGRLLLGWHHRYLFGSDVAPA